MSRTIHKTPIVRHYAKQKLLNRRKLEMGILDELQEENVPFRHGNRVRNFWANIVEPWDGQHPLG